MYVKISNDSILIDKNRNYWPYILHWICSMDWQTERRTTTNDIYMSKSILFLFIFILILFTLELIANAIKIKLWLHFHVRLSRFSFIEPPNATSLLPSCLLLLCVWFSCSEVVVEQERETLKSISILRIYMALGTGLFYR